MESLLGIAAAIVMLASPFMRGMFPKGSRARRYASPLTLLAGIIMMSVFIILAMQLQK